jgi:hypothetical protein
MGHHCKESEESPPGGFCVPQLAIEEEINIGRRVCVCVCVCVCREREREREERIGYPNYQSTIMIVHGTASTK